MNVTFFVVGTLKESYWRDAVAEYEKRLSAFCTVNWVQLKEYRLPEKPSEKEIETALQSEGRQMLEKTPKKALKIALCVEGKQYSSEELSELLCDRGDLCFYIGSSFGLSDEVKSACDLRLSFSKMTFPHQLARVVLTEALYRSFSIRRGTAYHK